MKYCLHSIKILENTNREAVIQLLAQEQFNARDAYLIEDTRMYNIDAGRNEVRAVVDDENNLVKLCCKHKNDFERMDARLLDFATKHQNLCELVINENLSQFNEY